MHINADSVVDCFTSSRVLSIIMPKQRRSCRNNHQTGCSSSADETSQRSRGRPRIRVVSFPSPTSTDVRSTESRPLTTDDIPSIVQQIAATLSAEHPSPPIPSALPTTAHTTTSVPSQRTSSEESTILPLFDTPLIVNAVVGRSAEEGSGEQSSSSTIQAGMLIQSVYQSLIIVHS